MKDESPEAFVVEVDWISRFGKLAMPGRCLSLSEGVTDGAPYFAYNNDYSPTELFFFKSQKEAEAFKHRVDTFYESFPQYFVIDDNGEKVLDEEGNQIVAWIPELSVTSEISIHERLSV